MNDEINWILHFKAEGISDIGKQLEGISKHLGKSNEDAKKTKESSEKAGAAMSKSSSSAAAFVTAMDKVGAALINTASKAISFAGSMLGSLATMAFDMAKKFGALMVTESAKKERDLLAYTRMMGSKKEARETYNDLNRLSATTGIDQEGLRTAQELFIKQGLRGRELKNAMYTTADVVAGSDPEKQAGRAKAFSKIYAHAAAIGDASIHEVYGRYGKLTKQLENAGVSSRGVLSALGAELGLKSRSAVENAIDKHKVTGTQLKTAIQTAEMGEFGTNKLGQYAGMQGQTMSATLKNLADFPKNVIRSLDETSMPNMSYFKEMLQELNSHLMFFGDTTGKVSEKVQNLKDMFFVFGDYLMGLLSALGSGIMTLVDNLSSTFMAVFKWFKISEDDTQESTETLTKAFKGLGWVIGTVAGFVFGGFISIVLKLTAGWKDFSRGVILLTDYVAEFWDKSKVRIHNFFDRFGEGLSGLGEIIAGILNFSPSQVAEGIKHMADAFTRAREGTDKITQEHENNRMQIMQMWRAEDEATAKDRAAKKKARQDEQANDNRKKEEQLKLGEFGKDLGKVWTWIPQFDHPVMSAIPAPLLGGLYTLMPSTGGTTSSLPVIKPGTLMTASGSSSSNVTFNIYDARNADEVVQKVEVSLTRILGRICANPQPGAM